MEFRSYASSSAGNVYTVSDAETAILVECGLPHSKLRRLVGAEMDRLSACLVSHPHKDHAKCVREILADGLPVYMSAGTALELGLEDAGVEPVAHLQQFSVGSLDIVPFDTYHDAAEPLGFVIRSRVDGDVVVFATDTCNLRYRFPGLNILAIEANYDTAILDRCERMPEKVRHRIRNTHMEIGTLCDILKGMDLSNCREIWLLHLSDATSHEGHFINKVARCVPPGIRIQAAPKGGK